MQKPKLTQKLEIDALGTRWWIEAECDSKILAHAEQTIVDFQNDHSRFLTESYIGKLNDNKVLDNPPQELVKMLEYQRDMFHATNGVFNSTVGGVLENQGYGLPGRAATLQQDIDAAITISPGKITLSHDTRIDLGGFGKGWLIDKLAELLKESGCYAFLINGGGDILVGTQGEDLFVEHPHDPGSFIGKVFVQNGALASSSTEKRRWKMNDSTYTHIVDTNQDSTDSELSIASVHVRADTALLADTLATVFLIVGHEKRLELAEKFGVSFLEVFKNDTLWTTQAFGYQNSKSSV